MESALQRARKLTRIGEAGASLLKHDEFCAAAEAGEIYIGVEPALARKFFTDTNHDKVIAAIGEPLYFERAVVRSFFILALILLFVSPWFACKAFGWWSLAVIPMSFAWGFYQNGISSIGRPSLWAPAAGVAAIVFVGIDFPAARPVCLWAGLIAGAILSSRLTYRCATTLISAIAVRNAKAYGILRDSVITVKPWRPRK